jgi:hypothetical protein
VCYFLAVGVAEHAVGDLTGTAPALFRVAPVANPDLRRLLSPRAAFWARSPDMCDCALYGALTEPEPTDEDLAASFRRRRQRTGWAPAKIERALAASLDAQRRRPPTAAGEWAEQFGAWMRSAVALGGEVALVAHEFGGPVEEERLALAGNLVVAVDDLVPGRAPLPTDTLIRIVRRKNEA